LEDAIGSCDPVPMWAMVVAMTLVELSNVKISIRDFNYCKEVGLMGVWSSMYRDHEEYIYTWLATGEVREWTDVPLYHLA
jgi:hypothetical protein